MEFINKFKIPTILGLSVIIFGIAGGVYLVLREQVFLSQAAPDLTPKNIAFTNLTENSVTISWQTNSAAPSFITFGQNSPGGQTVLDDRDATPTPHLMHYVTLKNLLPKTTYQFKIVSGKITSDTEKIETATPLTNQTGFTPIIGSILDGNSPLEDGIAYLSVSGATIQSSLVKNGNFLIPLSQIRKTDLSDIYQLTEGIPAKLTIHSAQGETQVLFQLKADSIPLPPVKLGQNIDLTAPETVYPPSSATSDLDQYDLNGDGRINTTDYATILRSQGKNPANVKTDINKDGTVDQKDLDLMSQKLKELNSQ